MGLIYVTGISGAGKSTVRAELRARGFVAHDVDEDGYKSWYRRESGTPAREQRAWADTDRSWQRRYWLKVDRAKVVRLAAEATGGPVFLCGTGPNDDEIWDLFEVIVNLTIGETVLKHRLRTRTNNDYGKHPEDLADIVGWNSVVAENMRAWGAVIIDAERPLAVVVDDVVRVASG
jgi:broad-specificity NMP kinase